MSWMVLPRINFEADSPTILRMKVTIGEKPYKCGRCYLAFTKMGSLKAHKRIHKTFE